MAGTNGGPVSALFDEQIVYGALDAIDHVLEQALTARTEIQQRWQLNQLRGLLLTLPSNGLGLEDSLRQLIRLLRTPLVDR
jgi:alcohol dehydrogenase YqhD (iron-dependent ADH family)